MTEKIYIFDTTLRDGEQSPGASMNLEEKIQIAEVLEEMKVDIIDKTEDKCVVCNVNKPTRYIQDVVSKCISHCETCYPKDQRTISVKFP